MSQCENEEESGNRYGGLQIVTEPVEGDSAPKHTPSRPSMYAVCQDRSGKNVGFFPPHFDIYPMRLSSM